MNLLTREDYIDATIDSVVNYATEALNKLPLGASVKLAFKALSETSAALVSLDMKA